MAGKKKSTGKSKKTSKRGRGTGLERVPALISLLTDSALVDELPPDAGAQDLAQLLVYEAWEFEQPEDRVSAAHLALSLWPDCADALLTIGEDGAWSSDERLAWAILAVRAAERALPEDYFETEVGSFWGLLETRPYMRARFSLAHHMHMSGSPADAIPHYVELLHLNPNDNQGIRYPLVAALIEAGQDAEARRWLMRYRKESSAEFVYADLLLTFRKSGASAKARQLLATARTANPHAITYFTGRKHLPDDLPAYSSPGKEEEAMHLVFQFGMAARMSEGFLEWLAQNDS